MANVKAQIMAASVVGILVLGAAMFIPKKDSTKPAIKSKSPYAIKIHEATYGRNCNGQTYYVMDKKLKKHVARTVKVEKNNKLELISNHCTGKEICNFTVTTSNLGAVDSGNCEPSIDIAYRCFGIDKLQKIRVDDDMEAIVDCKEHTVKSRIGM